MRPVRDFFAPEHWLLAVYVDAGVERSGVSCGRDHCCCAGSGSHLDLDTPDDLAVVEQTLSSTRGGAAHTRGMLRQLLRSRG